MNTNPHHHTPKGKPFRRLELIITAKATKSGFKSSYKCLASVHKLLAAKSFILCLGVRCWPRSEILHFSLQGFSQTVGSPEPLTRSCSLQSVSDTISICSYAIGWSGRSACTLSLVTSFRISHFLIRSGSLWSLFYIFLIQIFYFFWKYSRHLTAAGCCTLALRLDGQLWWNCVGVDDPDQPSQTIQQSFVSWKLTKQCFLSLFRGGV